MATVVGAGRFRFEAVPGWGEPPAGLDYLDVVGVVTDNADRAFVFNRSPQPIIIFDRDGNHLDSWGADEKFVRPHGIWISPEQELFLTDDMDHTVRKYTLDGKRLSTLGASGRTSDTGMEGFDFRTIRRGAGPFNHPTNLAAGSDGDLFIADGYGNARIHRFSPTGELLHSWGEPGSGPGQFNVPHGICVDHQGRVIVADRENSRLQWFSRDGEFLDEWLDVARPCEVTVDADDNVFVAELGFRAGMFPWMTSDPAGAGGRVSIFDSAGALLARWGGGDDPTQPHDFFAPHDIWLDSHGDLYIGEVTTSAAGPDRDRVASLPRMRKFRRVG